MSWIKWARCKVCGRKIAINNNPERETIVPRTLGVVKCPSCNERTVRMYLVCRDMAALLEAEEPPSKKQVRKLMKRAKEAMDCPAPS